MDKSQKEIFAQLLAEIKKTALAESPTLKTEKVFFDGLFYRPRVHKTQR